jgi:hypothetical protein
MKQFEEITINNEAIGINFKYLLKINRCEKCGNQFDQKNLLEYPEIHWRFQNDL